MPARLFRTVASLAAAAALFGLTGIRSGTLAERAPTLAIAPLASPAGAHSSEPQMTMEGDRVILSWLEVNGERATLKFSERTSAGWSRAKAVFSSGNFFVNAFDVPSVRLLADGTLAAHWMEQNGDNEDASQVRVSFSKDQGGTWSKPVSPHHDGTQTEHGFASLFQAPGAGLGMVWIDGRATNPEKETGDMSLRASIYDGRGKQLSEMVVTPRVCECCSTAAAETPDGVIVAFRNRSANEIRDIYVTRFAAGKWSAPNIVHADGWRIEACPINGPAISARGQNVAVAWFTAKEDKGQAYVAFSRDTGRTFGAPVRVDDGTSAGRLGVQLLDDGSAAVTWIESTNQHTRLQVRIITPGGATAGARSAPVMIAETEGSRYPRMARDHDELLFSWTDTDKGSSQVRAARAKIAQ
jgi:hypothetical protein